MRIFRIQNAQELRAIMRDIQVDPYGIALMVPKGITHLVRIRQISNITANILKQEMLSLGADAAIARGALTGAAKKTDCLLMANLAQFTALAKKLKVQPFGLKALGETLAGQLKNVHTERFVLRAGRYSLPLGERTRIMGIVNLTPDSFSMDGWYAQGSCLDLGALTEKVQEMVSAGADIIDIGGESSRPTSRKVTAKDEIARVLPAIKRLARTVRVPISIDTYKAQVAQYALDNGAVIVNDISGLRDPRMRRVVADYDAAAVLMHMQGTPQTMQNDPRYVSVIDEVIDYLDRAIDAACHAGVKRERIIIDPGIGISFGKTVKQNLSLIKNIADFKVLGRPILVGPSRKSFIGEILHGAAVTQRLNGTLAAAVLAGQAGAHLIRAHDVKAVKDALAVAQAIKDADL